VLRGNILRCAAPGFTRGKWGLTWLYGLPRKCKSNAGDGADCNSVSGRVGWLLRTRATLATAHCALIRSAASSCGQQVSQVRAAPVW